MAHDTGGTSLDGWAVIAILVVILVFVALGVGLLKYLKTRLNEPEIDDSMPES